MGRATENTEHGISNMNSLVQALRQSFQFVTLDGSCFRKLKFKKITVSYPAALLSKVNLTSVPLWAIFHPFTTLLRAYKNLKCFEGGALPGRRENRIKRIKLEKASVYSHLLCTYLSGCSDFKPNCLFTRCGWTRIAHQVLRADSIIWTLN